MPIRPRQPKSAGLLAPGAQPVPGAVDHAGCHCLPSAPQGGLAALLGRQGGGASLPSVLSLASRLAVSLCQRAAAVPVPGTSRVSPAAPILTPVPCGLQHAVWHQAAILAVMLACLPRQHQLSVARVAAADQHYMSAAQALLTAASALLPPGPSGWCARNLPRLLGPPGAFYLLHSTMLLLGALATLVVNFWFEVPRRVAFACENGMASAVDALMLRRSQWRRLGMPHCVRLVAAGWVAGCFATLPLKAAGLFGEA